MTTTTWTKTTDNFTTVYVSENGHLLLWEEAGEDSAWVLRTGTAADTGMDDRIAFNAELGEDDVAGAKAWAETVA